MGLHKFNTNHEQRKLWFKQNKNKITKIATITMSVIVFVVGVILLTKADFNSLFDLDMIGTKVGNFNSCNYENGHSWYFDYNGTDGTDGSVQEFTVPCNGTYKIELWGAQGGVGYDETTVGGLGGYTSGNIDLIVNDNLYFYVGAQGTDGKNIKIFNNGTSSSSGWNGGGATDVRLVNGTWDTFDSLKSRIMVAGGGGTKYQSGVAGDAGGLNGYNGNGTAGGTQNTVGSTTYIQSTFGVANGGCTGGNGYNPGGGATCAHGSGGGSSFISGYSGCNAISYSSTDGNIIYTNQPNHYSGKIFTDSVMIDGKGCDWSTGVATNCGLNQVQPNGSYATGHTGNGYAIITYIASPVVSRAPKVELYDGMVPVTYDNNGNTLVADLTTDWYNYADHRWANAVLVSNTSTYLDSNNNVLTNKKGTVIPSSDIQQYYVYIPRYKYKLFNTNNESIDEQMIEIEFQNNMHEKANGTNNGEWLTHPAFTFGDTELNGFWVAKFEPSISSGTLSCTDENCNVSNLRVLPNSYSVVDMKLGNQFYSTRSMENYFNLNTNQVDTHMMKNMEWGAVAYLSSSIYGLYSSPNTCINSDNNYNVTLNNSTTANRCQIWTNNVHVNANGNWGTTITGCSAKTTHDDSNQNNMTSCGTGYEWNGSINKGRSSTTGNLYGIYDMAGGLWEHIMGNVAGGTTTYSWQIGNSELTEPNSKYYDAYTNSDDLVRSYKYGKLGDSTRETIKTVGSDIGSWFGDYSTFPDSRKAFFIRGGMYDAGARSGIFDFYYYDGSSLSYITFRPIITKD